MYHERSKHIDIRHHFIRDMVEKGQIEVKKVKGDVNPADFGTKVVTADKFCFCRDALHIWDVP